MFDEQKPGTHTPFKATYRINLNDINPGGGLKLLGLFMSEFQRKKKDAGLNPDGTKKNVIDKKTKVFVAFQTIDNQIDLNELDFRPRKDQGAATETPVTSPLVNGG